MTTISRRSMIERLGLFASAPLLVPIARTLVREARGADLGKRRCAIFMVIGENMPEKPAHGIVPQTAWDQTDGKLEKITTDLSMPLTAPPELLSPMRPYWSRMAVIDGLAVRRETVGGAFQHGLGFTVLSGAAVLDKSPETGGKPGAKTIDQHVAEVLGKDTPLSSILFGSPTGATFAVAPEKPVSEYSDPSKLFEALAGKGSGTAPSASTGNRAQLQARLMDVMRSDIRRLQSELAGAERTRLDDYLSAIDDYDKRQTALAAALQSGDCGMPPQPMVGDATQKIRSMFAMSSLALRCGLTNVVGMSVGHGFGHDDAGGFNDGVFGGEGYGGHNYDGTIYAPQYKKLYHFMLNQLAEMFSAMGSLLDGTTFVLMPGTTVTDAGHHSQTRTCGVVFDGSGTMKTGGTFTALRRGSVNFPDFLCTATHAAGVPTDNFNGGRPMAAFLR